MTFDRCHHILYYATLHNQYCNSQKYQSYSLTNAGAQDVDWKGAKIDKALYDTVRPPRGVTDERIIGQKKVWIQQLRSFWMINFEIHWTQPIYQKIDYIIQNWLINVQILVNLIKNQNLNHHGHPKMPSKFLIRIWIGHNSGEDDFKMDSAIWCARPNCLRLS